MSGFIAIAQRSEHVIDSQQLTTLTASMAKQGPDAQEVWSKKNVGFGHALLKTTRDSINEKQPLTIDNRVWITGDCRLDRRDELIDRLKPNGQPAHHSLADINLVLLAYLAWGETCLQKISGDFAFAIWDASLQQLFCARDHFGVVPFYYSVLKEQIVCSNHLQCLTQHPGISDQLNDKAIGDFLLFGMNRDLNSTTYTDIQKLAPASQLTWTAGNLQIKNYWQLAKSAHSIRYQHSKDYIDHFHELFAQSIADRLRTNQAASHLSGGMDSTSIAATVYQQMKRSGKPIDFRAYVIVYQQLLQEQEGHYAEQVAAHSGFPLAALIAEDYIQQAPLKASDYVTPEPLMFSNQVAEHEITHRVSEFSRVLFAGFGGDPAFYQCPLFWSGLIMQGRFFQLGKELYRYINTAHRLPPLGLRSRLRGKLGKKNPHHRIPEWLNPDFVSQQQLDLRYQQIISKQPNLARAGMSSEPLWSNIFAWSSPGFHGLPVKVRFPFFDLSLVTYLQSIPPAPWLIDKRLLRESMTETLPESIVKRPKTPLPGSPHFNLMQQRGMQAWMKDLINQTEIETYVSRDLLLQTFKHNDTITPASYSRSMLPLVLAHWMLLKR